MAKTLYTQVGEVKGKGLDSQTVFTHQYTPAADELKNSRGSLYTLINLYEVSGSEAVKIDREIFQTFQSSYFSSSVGGVLAALESAFEQTDKALAEKERATAVKIKYDFVAAVLWGEALYLVKTQNTAIIFQRAGVAKELKFNKTASGSIQDKDNICLVNKKYVEQVDIESIAGSLRKEDFQEALKGLNSSAAEKEGAEALLLRIYLEEPKQQVVEMIDVEEKREKKVLDKVRTLIAKTPAYLSPLGQETKDLSTSLRKKVTEYLGKAADKAFEPWRPREPGSLEDPAKRRRARAAQIAVVLILLLSLSVGLAVMSRQNSANQAAFEEKLTVVAGTLDEAENLAEISPERSGELLLKAEQDLVEAQQYGIENEKFDSLQLRFNSLQEAIRNIHTVNLEEFHKSANVKVADLVLTSKKIVIFDREKSKVVAVDRGSKEEREIFFQSGANQIALSGDNLYIQSQDGIRKVNLSTSESTKVKEPHSEWGNLVSADVYQGNLYLLDSAKKVIWKYLPAGDGLTQPNNYFKGNVELGDPTSIAIDGVIWVGNKGGKIFKFLGGAEQKFEISNLDKPLGEIADIFTTQESGRLFILDKGNSRIVILGKDGIYISQHASDEFKDARSLVADEKSKTIFVGIGDSIKTFKY